MSLDDLGFGRGLTLVQECSPQCLNNVYAVAQLAKKLKRGRSRGQGSHTGGGDDGIYLPKSPHNVIKHFLHGCFFRNVTFETFH